VNKTLIHALLFINPYIFDALHLIYRQRSEEAFAFIQRFSRESSENWL